MFNVLLILAQVCWYQDTEMPTQFSSWIVLPNSTKIDHSTGSNIFVLTYRVQFVFVVKLNKGQHYIFDQTRGGQFKPRGLKTNRAMLIEKNNMLTKLNIE